MSDDESPLRRWSRRKRTVRAGRPAADPPTPEGTEPAVPGRGGGARPVAGRRLVPSLPPLAGAEDDPNDPYRSAPIVQAHGLPPAAAPETPAADAEQERPLTPEEAAAVKDLPPIESLDRDSDFTPFLAKNVPEFIQRKALKVLWRSDPVLANLDGLNDYDEDFTMAAIVADALQAAKEARRAAKEARRAAKKAAGKDRPGQATDPKAAETRDGDSTTAPADREADQEPDEGADGEANEEIGDADAVADAWEPPQPDERETVSDAESDVRPPRKH